ncbi:hypothetical protein OUZ56_008618 [Daphnia magna]|uniref:Uncharacterized protein n=1 Tax=Daphnia magna TaxID=35525 RepID=A0ABR0ADJ5_9CRUS|nr:hypothetical protein OUZ56_008618 [Daphnia magna]
MHKSVVQFDMDHGSAFSYNTNPVIATNWKYLDRENIRLTPPDIDEENISSCRIRDSEGRKKVSECRLKRWKETTRLWFYKMKKKGKKKKGEGGGEKKRFPSKPSDKATKKGGAHLDDVSWSTIFCL